MSLLAAGLVILDILLYTAQNFFNKLYSLSYDGVPGAVTPVFSIIYGGICALITFIAGGFRFAPSLSTCLLGVINGIALFAFNFASINAAQRGPYAFQSLCMLVGGILPSMLFCAFFWGERLGAVKYAGIALMLAALYVFNCKGLRFNKVKKGYFIFTAVVLLSNGLYSTAMDAQQRLNANTQRSEMIMVTFLVSAILSLIYLLALRCGVKKAFRMSRKPALYALCSAAAATAAVNMMLMIFNYVPSTILFTFNNGGVMVCLALLSTIVLHEKIEKQMWAGIAMAVGSLVLLGML